MAPEIAAKRLYTKARGQLASIERAICIDDLPSCRAGESQQRATMPARRRSVNYRDDAEREVERAARTHEGARQLQVGARVDEHPGVLLAEAEEPELVEAPAHDALVLRGQLVRLR